MTEQLSRCCETLQKLRMRLGPSNFILLIVKRQDFRCGSTWFIFDFEFLCCLHILYIFIYLVKFG